MLFKKFRFSISQNDTKSQVSTGKLKLNVNKSNETSHVL